MFSSRGGGAGQLIGFGVQHGWEERRQACGQVGLKGEMFSLLMVLLQFLMCC